MADFASMLKLLRERENLSQRELAIKLGMSASAIGMYESGERHPKPEIEETIADFFNVDLNTLRGKRVIEENPERILRALKLLDSYENATPDRRAMVDFALTQPQQTPVLPHLH